MTKAKEQTRTFFQKLMGLLGNAGDALNGEADDDVVVECDEDTCVVVDDYSKFLRTGVEKADQKIAQHGVTRQRR